jgi:hypothetical protein
MATFRAVNDCHLIFTISQNRLTTVYIRACTIQAKGRRDVSVFLRITANCPLLQVSIKCEWRDSQCDSNNRRNAGTVTKQPTANVADLWQDFKRSCLQQLAALSRILQKLIIDTYRRHTCPRRLRNCLLTTWTNTPPAMSQPIRGFYTTKLQWRGSR